jgi:hypothetical protein
VGGEITDFGGSGSLILDGEEGTDIEVATAAVWLNTAASWDLVRQRGALSLAPSAMQSWWVSVRLSPVARWKVSSRVVKCGLFVENSSVF